MYWLSLADCQAGFQCPCYDVISLRSVRTGGSQEWEQQVALSSVHVKATIPSLTR